MLFPNDSDFRRPPLDQHSLFQWSHHHGNFSTPNFKVDTERSQQQSQMWIIPSNHRLYSRFARGFLASREDLSVLSEASTSWPTWRSKRSSLQTYWRGWKRVSWIPPLFGRTLKPSMHVRFVERYTASLPVIHVPENRSPGYGRGIYTKDSFGRLYAGLLATQDLFGVGSKTSMITSRELTRLYSEAYAIWVTQLKREYSRRLRSARHRIGADSSYLLWPTPCASDWRGAESIENWTKRRDRKKQRFGGGMGMTLSTAVARWETGPHHRETSNGHSKKLGRLNPAWVAQLMGTTLEKTFFVPMETASWSTLQK